VSPAGGDGRDTIPSMLAATVEQFGDHPAIIDGDTALTYAELADQARRFGAALVATGVEPDDRVAIWAFNSVEWVVAVLGLFEAGAVLVPVNSRFKGAEAADILTRSRAKVLVTVTDFLGTDYVAMLAASGVELPSLRTTVIARGPAPSPAEAWGGFLARATDDVERQEEIAQVLRALEDLPADQKEVIVLGVFQDLSYAEIEDITGTKAVTLRSRMFHGLKRLARSMGSPGDTEPGEPA